MTGVDGRTDGTYTKHNPGRPGDWEVAGLRWLAEATDRGGAVVVGARGREGDETRLDRVAPAPHTDDATARGHAEQFGRALVHTHAAGAPAFGAPPDGWSGAGYQGPNDALRELPLAPHDRWGTYWSEVMLRPLVADLWPDLGSADRRDVGALLDRLGSGEYDDDRPPARIHGDLWAGNVLWGPDGAVLIDPAAHGGHPGADLAALALFGAPHLGTILGAYAEEAGLDAGWRHRTPLHQLHLLLLHAVLFGGGYVDRSLDAVRQALAL